MFIESPVQQANQSPHSVDNEIDVIGPRKIRIEDQAKILVLIDKV